MGFGSLPDWLTKKCCIYALDTFDDNPCICRCLAIHKRHICGKEDQVHKRNHKSALNLALEYFDDKKLK